MSLEKGYFFMAEEYVLAREIIHDHGVRMMNIKKYYPYFKLTEGDFSYFQGGKYSVLDMGYILMAVLRFFIEENSFNEKDVTYDEYELFMKDIYARDFDLHLSESEEKEISSYIFDRIRNDGKPFVYQYFEPTEKLKLTIRMRIIDSRIKNDTICYFITSDAIEFYLDTKEIKDESTISIAQVLLSKMIENRNFKGGTEVIKRINSEVNRLKMKKNDVLAIMSEDVFEGVKAYEEFVNTGIRWFDEEQKSFEKNMELIHEALMRAEGDSGHTAVLKDLYELETELKKAIVKHSELLNACTDLQLMADEMVSAAKFSRLRRSFDFADALKVAMEEDNAGGIGALIAPLLTLNIKKTFNLTSIDKLLTLPALKEEKGEEITEAVEEEYVYEDELEEQRIEENYRFIIINLLEFINRRESFKLSMFNDYIRENYGDSVLKNSDYYSLLVHMCGKKEYIVGEVLKKPDTFFEEYMVKAIQGAGTDKYNALSFKIENLDTEEISMLNVAHISDVRIERTGCTG